MNILQSPSKAEVKKAGKEVMNDITGALNCKQSSGYVSKFSELYACQGFPNFNTGHHEAFSVLQTFLSSLWITGHHGKSLTLS